MGRSIHHPVGLLYYAPQSAYRGYTLYCNAGGNNEAYLIDMEGNVCHRWENEEGIGYARFLPNGNLLCKARPPREVEGFRGFGGSGSAILELDWDGNVVWRYDNIYLHHDYARLPNGNTIVPLWDELSKDMTNRIKGGYIDDETPEQMYGDSIVEIAPDGVTELRKWCSWEHLDFDEDIICPLENRREWTHLNSVDVMENGDWLVSMRLIDTLGIISKDTGEFTWKWGKKEISHTHHATSLEGGNVIVFDNGSHRKGMNFSRVVEVNPATNEIEWEYRGSPPPSLYSFHISGAERLPNGNTLICEGSGGRLLEVTHNKEIVWEFINPIFTPDARGGSTSNYMYRAHRYGPDHPALKGKDLDPARYANHNRLYVARS